MKNEVLIVLGSPNSPAGELSEISKSRLDFCANIYSEGMLVLCTGGWGEHFNTAKEAHAFYAKKYLIKKGIQKDDFLDFALSENTVDDAVKIKEIVAKLEQPRLTVITSDYHLERVQLIFGEILHGYNIKYMGAPGNIENHLLQHLINHEKEAIQSIVKNGLYY